MLGGIRSAADIETAMARLGEVGLEAMDIAATISATGTTSSVRELPRISIDLHSTVPGRPAARAGATAPKVERDLEVLSTLGEGGMGRVLLARQHSLDREVAIKTLHGSASEREREALISEGAITGHLEHPSIVPVHALGLDGEGRPVLVMKRVEGVEWTTLITEGREPLTRHLEILMQVCNAVGFAHSRRIVHRDIKPQNVLIGRHGDVYLCDWGLAVRIDRDWDTQPLCGTPGYMAPEMVLGAPVDERTDVYLLGATLHFVLTGQPRNAGRDARTASLAALDATPPTYPESVPEQLAALVRRATARDPAERPASADELRRAIADYQQHRSSLALARSAVERVEELRRLSGGDLGDEAAHRHFERLAVEARFALEQARGDWGDNPAAADATRALDEVLAARHARAAELERLAREHDPRPLGPYRTLGMIALAVVAVALSARAIAMYPDHPSPRGLFLQSLVPTGLLLAMIVALRRNVLATPFNRRLVWVGVLAVGGVTLARGLALRTGAQVDELLLHDAVLCVIGLGVAAVFLFRGLVWPTLLMLACAIAISASPPHAYLFFSLATGPSLCLVAYVIWRAGRITPSR